MKAAVADFMNRSDATSAIPSFITLAEAEINRKLRCRQMIARATAIVSDEFESVPADFAGSKSLDLDGTTHTIHLDYCAPDEILWQKAQRTTVTGDPEMYSIQGADIQLFPAPTGAMTARMVYYRTIPALSGSRETNWLLTQYPDAYLYGSLSQAGMWLRGDPRMADFIATFEEILSNIQEINKVEADAPRLEMPSRLVV